MPNDRTPILIGVGEASERVDAPDYQALSAADLAGRAAAAALADAGAGRPLAAELDVIAGLRQFETSNPKSVAPFGRADNFPRAVAKRVGADPARAILEPIGGQGPQHLINEFAGVIARGEARLALFCGAEAVSTVRHLSSRGEKRDWSETVPGDLEDRGYGPGLNNPELSAHGAITPMILYAMFENACRAKRGLSRDAWRLEMGRLLAPFTAVAHANPHAMSHEVFSAEELAEVTPRNRLVADPYPRRMVSRDQTNQGAAVLMTSVGAARELGVPEERWIYLHGGADATERLPLERRDLSAYAAAGLAARQALQIAGITVADVGFFDLYSCFPIAVSSVRDELGLSPDDPRPLTQAGGLPFFGGAGNNYSMHAIAALVRRLRRERDAYGFIGANGGYLSKYSTGVYSARPSDWTGGSSAAIQAEIDAWPAPALASEPSPEGVVETYTIDYGREQPVGIVIARTAAGARFVAVVEDLALVERMIADDPLGARLACRGGEGGRHIVASLAR
jgi:acetyl-CoA C-acetyltransferase